MEIFGIICSVIGAGTLAHLFVELVEKVDGGVGHELGHDGQRDRRHVAGLQKPE